jgi:hypothetical protein
MMSDCIYLRSQLRLPPETVTGMMPIAPDQEIDNSVKTVFCAQESSGRLYVPLSYAAWNVHRAIFVDWLPTTMARVDREDEN